MQKGKPWTFASLRQGQEFGETQVTIDAERIAEWTAIYGKSGGDGVPPGLLVVEMMRVYLDLVQPRPPGNIHAGQKLRCIEMDVPKGATITASVRCLKKTERKGRNWVHFGVVLRLADRDILQGEIQTIWAG